MPQTLQQLTLDLSKQAKLSSLGNSLPIILRPLPAAAILVGNEIAKATNGRNVIEERLLGDEPAISLQAPSHSTSLAAGATNTQTHAIWIMCGTCNPAFWPQQLDSSLGYGVVANTPWQALKDARSNPLEGSTGSANYLTHQPTCRP
jgi:hypothetical protein